MHEEGSLAHAQRVVTMEGRAGGSAANPTNAYSAQGGFCQVR